MPSARRTLLTGFLLAGSLAVFAAFAAAFFAEAYGRLTSEQRSGGDSSMVAVSAGRHAVKLQPWRQTFRSDLAWTLGLRGEAEAMRAHYRGALRWNPANAYLWLEYAQALARARRIDPEYTLALQRGVALTHARPALLLAARMGANHWSEGGSEDRALWARSMTFALRAAPLDFLWAVTQARREVPVCGYLGTEFALSRWCTAVQGARQICDTLAPGAEGPAANECRRLGMYVTSDDSRTAE